MAYWDWDRSYELGIDIIDKQHQRIVQYINDLQNTLKTRDREKIADTIANIADYTVSHFAHEELLMEKAGCASLEIHKKIHESFMQTVERYQNSFKQGYDIAGQLMAELQIWLTYHILNEDKSYAQSIKRLFEKESQPKKTEIKKRSWFAKLFGG
ncbi:MAG: bacteriohemerythrin [Campylobacteraceae bacterium]|jgi:hemerythrin|nr:bacteriohemerythrin [Campylobacteraceae bacterium]